MLFLSALFLCSWEHASIHGAHSGHSDRGHSSPRSQQSQQHHSSNGSSIIENFMTFPPYRCINLKAFNLIDNSAGARHRMICIGIVVCQHKHNIFFHRSHVFRMEHQVVNITKQHIVSRQDKVTRDSGHITTQVLVTQDLWDSSRNFWLTETNV